MKKILISSTLIILALLLLFGCTNTGINLTCPDGQLVMDISECVEPVDATVTVSANIPWDIEGDVFLRWYKNQEISSNLSSSVITRLGEHWLGSQNKNLYISFNDSESGELPITRENNKVVVSIPEQGEYYFELASEDYEYRAVSEKILVTQNGDIQVYLNLVPSNPAIRIRGVGESWERLSGPGKVTLFATRHYDNYGEWTEDTFEYGSMTFSDGEEINALFFVNSYNISQNESISYFTEVEKDGYLGTRQNIWTNGKINVYDVQLRQANPPGTGDLEVQITTGTGTTWEDIQRLNGQMATLTMTSSPYTQYTATINDERVTFENIAFGTYRLSAQDGDYASDIPFVTIAAEEIEVNATFQGNEAKALLGSSMHLTVLDSTGELIPTEQLKLTRARLVIDDEPRQDINYSPPASWATNPMIQARGFYDEYSLEIENASVYYLTLAYNGLEQEFMINMKQGRNEVVWQFDANTALNLLEIRTGEVFPYDSTQTINPGWKAGLSSTGTGIVILDIYNNHAFIQSKTESSNSKFMLAKGESLELPLNLAEVKYNGNLDVDTGMISKIGSNGLELVDPNGVERTIPYVISLTQGTNTIEIDRDTFEVAVDPNEHDFTYDAEDGFSRQYYQDNTIGNVVAGFIIDSSLDVVKYRFGADETTGQFWLFLEQQDFKVKNGILSFDGISATNINDNISNLEYYLPDQSIYNVLDISDPLITPDEGDDKTITAKWHVTPNNSSQLITMTNIYQDTATGFLIDSTDGRNRPGLINANPVSYPYGFSPAYWELNHTTQSDALRLLKGITEYGVISEIESNEFYFRIPTTKSVYTTTALKYSAPMDNMGQSLDLNQNVTTGSNVVLYRNNTQVETLNYAGTVKLQTIADGFNPGNVLLKVDTQGISYVIEFEEPILFGTNTGQVVDIAGNTYNVVEATLTKLILEPIN
jgi:hypothetical protein